MNVLLVVALLIIGFVLTGWLALTTSPQRVAEFVAGRERVLYRTDKRIAEGVILVAAAAFVVCLVTLGR